MKRRTTRKKQLEHSIKKRQYLINCIVSSVIAVFLLIASIGSVIICNSNKLTENDIEYKEYTINKIEGYGGRSFSFDVYVEEKDTSLIIHSVVADVLEVRNKISDLKQGDKIFCYITKETDEIVEMKTNEIIFTFDEYKEQSKRVGLLGLFIMPVLTIAFGINATLSAIEYKKTKKC